ncbi:ubiquitin-like protein [Ceratobasidium sp. AG-I]|nr:ubiquitin-like protein [Ceratobasidium sp. AG-I]KAF8601995.1 ubiquitin-like protein [Ceratobasidium sp. AG-I]
MGTQQTNDAMDDAPDAGANDEEPQSTPASKSDKITLVIRSQEGPSFQLKVARTKPLKAAFDKAHEQFRKAPGTFRFIHNGNRLRDEDTPKMHEMEDEDEIDAQLQQVGGSHIA